jgi:hypothetical protein
MSKHNNRQEDYNKLLATLRELSIEDLLLLFIEAKTGSQEDIDRLPVGYLETVEELGELLNSFYSDRVIDSLFKKDK